MKKVLEFFEKTWQFFVGAIAVIVAIFVFKSSSKDKILEAEKDKNKKLSDLNKNIRDLESEGKLKVFDKFAESSEEIQKEAKDLHDQIESEHQNKMDSIKSAEDATEAIKDKLK